MEISAAALIGLALLIVAMFLIPLGLPGIWMMMAVLAVGVVAGEVSILLFLALLAVAAAVELAEYLALDRIGRRYGGSRRTFWGALAGGLVGAIVGLPLPAAGTVSGLFFGTLVGATVAGYSERRTLGPSLRAGWGAVLGRAVAVALKVFAGLLILLAGGAALLIS